MRCSCDLQGCPCGYLGHIEKACRCLPSHIERYRSRISGPLLDRVDVLIEVPPLTLEALEDGARGESSAAIRERVAAAHVFRRERCGRHSDAAPQVLEERCRLTGEARGLLRHALRWDGLSGRAYVRIIKLARTIADLDNVPIVGAEHLAEALALRLDHRRVGLT